MGDWLVIDVRCGAETARLLGARRVSQSAVRSDAVRLHDEHGRRWQGALPPELLEAEELGMMRSESS